MGLAINEAKVKILGCRIRDLENEIFTSLSMPLWLVHESFLHSPVLKTLDEVAISPTRCSAASPAGTPSIAMHLGRWWIVCGTGLQSNRSIGIEVACHSLD